MGQAIRNLIYILLFVVFILVAMTTQPYSIGRGTCADNCMAAKYQPINLANVLEQIENTYSPMELIAKTIVGQ